MVDLAKCNVCDGIGVILCFDDMDDGNSFEETDGHCVQGYTCPACGGLGGYPLPENPNANPDNLSEGPLEEDMPF